MSENNIAEMNGICVWQQIYMSNVAANYGRSFDFIEFCVYWVLHN